MPLTGFARSPKKIPRFSHPSPQIFPSRTRSPWFSFPSRAGCLAGNEVVCAVSRMLPPQSGRTCVMFRLLRVSDKGLLWAGFRTPKSKGFRVYIARGACKCIARGACKKEVPRFPHAFYPPKKWGRREETVSQKRRKGFSHALSHDRSCMPQSVADRIPTGAAHHQTRESRWYWHGGRSGHRAANARVRYDETAFCSIEWSAKPRTFNNPLSKP